MSRLVHTTLIRSLLSTTAALSLACVPSAAMGDPPILETPAQQYARHSVTILGSPELSVPLTATGRILVDGVVRINFAGGFVVQPRVGLGLGFSTLANGAELIARPGIGIGYAFPIRRTIAITPSVGYDLFIESSVEAGSVLFIQRAALDLPVSIVFDSALIEPYVLAGVSIFEGQPDVALAIGLRIGFMIPTGRRPAARSAAPAPTATAPPLAAPSAVSSEPPASAPPSPSSDSPALDSVGQ